MSCFCGKVDDRRILITVYITPLTETEGDTFAISAKRNVFRALVDTGAMGSCISPRVPEVLGINAKGMSRMGTAGGSQPCRVYRVNIHIPIEVSDGKDRAVNIRPFKNIEVAEVTQHEKYDVIVGMDIISAGALNVSGENFVFCT